MPSSARPDCRELGALCVLAVSSGRLLRHVEITLGDHPPLAKRMQNVSPECPRYVPQQDGGHSRCGCENLWLASACGLWWSGPILVHQSPSGRTRKCAPMAHPASRGGDVTGRALWFHTCAVKQRGHAVCQVHGHRNALEVFCCWLEEGLGPSAQARRVSGFHTTAWGTLDLHQQDYYRLYATRHHVFENPWSRDVRVSGVSRLARSPSALTGRTLLERHGRFRKFWYASWLTRYSNASVIQRPLRHRTRSSTSEPYMA